MRIVENVIALYQRESLSKPRIRDPCLKLQPLPKPLLKAKGRAKPCVCPLHIPNPESPIGAWIYLPLVSIVQLQRS